MFDSPEITSRNRIFYDFQDEVDVVRGTVQLEQLRRFLLHRLFSVQQAMRGFSFGGQVNQMRVDPSAGGHVFLQQAHLLQAVDGPILGATGLGVTGQRRGLGQDCRPQWGAGA